MTRPRSAGWRAWPAFERGAARVGGAVVVQDAGNPVGRDRRESRFGERGRAHVFSPEGKLVTSVRYNPPAEPAAR